jgi:hypothetical protein
MVSKLGLTERLAAAETPHGVLRSVVYACGTGVCGLATVLNTALAGPPNGGVRPVPGPSSGPLIQLDGEPPVGPMV